MLFNISHDNEEFFVEANTMENAIKVWRESFADFDGDETPSAVLFISETPVIRQIEEPAPDGF